MTVDVAQLLGCCVEAAARAATLIGTLTHNTTSEQLGVKNKKGYGEEDLQTAAVIIRIRRTLNVPSLDPMFLNGVPTVGAMSSPLNNKAGHRGLVDKVFN